MPSEHGCLSAKLALQSSREREMLKRREKDGVKETQAETVGWRGKKYLCTGKQRQCYEGKIAQ